MTKREAQERNWNIGNLMGQLPRLKRIIPADIVARLDPQHFSEFLAMADIILQEIQQVKIKRFTCEYCHTHTPRPTTNEKAYQCDFCGTWDKPLYNIKKD